MRVDQRLAVDCAQVALHVRPPPEAHRGDQKVVVVAIQLPARLSRVVLQRLLPLRLRSRGATGGLGGGRSESSQHAGLCSGASSSRRDG